MERILQHYVPNISFDIQSLRKTAEELKHRHRHSFTDASPSVRLDEEDFEDLAIDDEDYMVKALPDNTTRACFRPNLHFWLLATALCAGSFSNSSDCRIFRRVFLSELVYENSTEDR